MDAKRYEEGLEVRRAVLGRERVDKMISEATDFDRDWQDLLTEYCWGSIWTRPGLDRRTRSLINVAMLAATKSTFELGVHIKSAFKNGCTKEEIREVLMQVAIYAGVPSAVDGFKLAKEALIERGEWEAPRKG